MKRIALLSLLFGAFFFSPVLGLASTEETETEYERVSRILGELTDEQNDVLKKLTYWEFYLIVRLSDEDINVIRKMDDDEIRVIDLIYGYTRLSVIHKLTDAEIAAMRKLTEEQKEVLEDILED